MGEHAEGRTPPTTPPPLRARPPLLERRRGTVRTRCPRCGYELRGVVQIWTDRCPLDGRCPECGLEFPWRDIFRPHFGVPGWCVEFAPRRRWFDACVRTFVRAQWPGFWKRFSIRLPIRGRRLAGFVLTVAAAVYVLTALASGVGYALDARNAPVPRTMARQVPLDPILELVARGALTPWSNQGAAAGGMQYRGLTPRAFWRKAWRGEVRRGSRSGGLLWPWMPVVFLSGCALALVALRTTMARARVRTVHIVRIVIYGLAFPVLLFVLELGMLVLNGAGWGSGPQRFTGFGAAIGVFAAMLWWRAALVHYLRVEAPGLVLASCFIVAALATLALIHYAGHPFTVQLFMPLMPKR